MDELEVAFSHPQSKRTDCNHIFLNFIPTVIMDPAKIEEAVTNTVLRYGPRLWKLRVLQAEIKVFIRQVAIGNWVSVKAATNTFCIGLRLMRLQLQFDFVWLTTVVTIWTSTCTLKLWIQSREKFSSRHLEKSRGPCMGFPFPLLIWQRIIFNKKGIWSLSSVVFKFDQRFLRFQAQSNGTTYVYDYPEMFRQMVDLQWKQYSQQFISETVNIPDKFMDFVELVLDIETETRLVEQKRVAGEFYFYLFKIMNECSFK